MVRKAGLRTGVTLTKLETASQEKNPLLKPFGQYMGKIANFEVPRPYDEFKPVISEIMTKEEYNALGVIAKLVETGMVKDLEHYLEQIHNASDIYIYNINCMKIYLKIILRETTDFQELFEEVHSIHVSIRLHENLRRSMEKLEDQLIGPEEIEAISFTFYPVLFNEIQLFRLKGLILPASANMLRMVQAMHQAERYVERKKIRKEYLPRFLNDLSVAYSLIGAIETAIDYSQRVLDILSKKDEILLSEFHQFMITLLNLATFYVWTNRPEKIDGIAKMLDHQNIKISNKDREIAKKILKIQEKSLPESHSQIMETYKPIVDHLLVNSSAIHQGLIYFIVFQFVLESFFHQDKPAILQIIETTKKALETEKDETLAFRGELIISLASDFETVIGKGSIRKQLSLLTEKFYEYLTLPQYGVFEFTTYHTIILNMYISSLVSSHHDPKDLLIRSTRLYSSMEKKVGEYKMTKAVELNYHLNRLLSLIYFLLHQDERRKDHFFRAHQLASGQFPIGIPELDPRALINEDQNEYPSIIREDLESVIQDQQISEIYEEFVIRRSNQGTVNLGTDLVEKGPVGKTSRKEWNISELQPPIDLPHEEEAQQQGNLTLNFEKTQPYGFWTVFTHWEADLLKKIRFLLWSGRFKDAERLIIMVLATEIREIVRFQILVMKILNDLLMWRLQNEPKENSNEFWEALEIWEKMNESEKFLFLASRNLVLFRKAFGYTTNEDIFALQENEKVITWMGEELHFDLVSLLIIKFFFDREKGITNKDIVDLLSGLEEDELNPVDFYNILIMRYITEKNTLKKAKLINSINDAAEKYGFPFVEDEENAYPIFL